MSYAVVISEQVREVLQSLPFELTEFVWDRFEELLEDPVTLGQPGDARDPAGQRYRFLGNFGPKTYLFEASFRYLDTADENQLLIAHLVVSEWLDAG